ncbi:MAG TPA: PxKF domain-containing protein [Acidimicrobiales bacterium]|nr:PxKF domain-containing protein [Acidimicrobiales bacterium]
MSRIRTIQRLGAGVAVAVLALALPASAAELLTAELEGTANQVTVEQGKSQNFNISLSASGSVACGSTHTAKVHQSYAISAAGAVSSQTLSAGVSFSAASPEKAGDANCAVTWTGAPTPQTVAAAVSATATTPVGTYTVILKESNGNTATSSSNSSGGKLDDNDATTLTITVVAPTVSAPANTAPTVSVAGVTDGASYDKGSVPAATCVVTDAEDGNSSFPATLSAITGLYASDGIGEQTASCSYTDRGTPPLTAAASKTYNIVDPSAPIISHVLNPAAPDGLNDWYTSNVSLAWTVTENESPNSLQTTGCVDQNVTVDQVATKYSCSASSAGGPAGTDVTIKRDATPPTVALLGGPADGATYYVGLDTIPAAPTCSASDATSLVANCDVTGYSKAVGTHTVQATATDNAGNPATSSPITYTVANLTLNGFYQPVNMGSVLNTVKGGSTVPLKFEVFAGSTELSATSIVKSFGTRSIQCDGTALSDEVEITSTGGTSLRYDATAGQFIQNWATPKSPGACIRATLTLNGGQVISADFKLR